MPGRRPIIGSRPKRIFVPGKRRNSSMMSASHRKSGSREALVRRLPDRSSGGRTSHSKICDFIATARLQIAIRKLTRNSLEHFGVRREFFHEHQQTLDRFLWFVTGETATDEVDFLQFPRLQQQFFAPRAGEENIDSRINPLIADFPVKHHFHISGAFKFLKDEFVHATPGFYQRGGYDGERSSFFGVTRRCENFAWNFHRASVDATTHGATAASHRIIECASRARDRVEQDEYVFAGFDEPFGALEAGKH